VKDVIRSSSSLANRTERRELTGWLAFARVAGNDAPLIGARAPTRGRIAMEGGGDRVGAKSTLPFERQLANQIE
jgi:hypothetical protein